MSTYILLLTLDADGREQMFENPESLLLAVSEISIPDVQSLGIYAVLGGHDFVMILEAADNEAAARFSIELGARAGAHISTLPAIPIGQLETEDPGDTEDESASRALEQPHAV
jgi:uncharacterized protein with GYD domain